MVTPGTPIVRLRSAAAANSSPGAILPCCAEKKPDGTFEAARINVGRDGVVPQ